MSITRQPITKQWLLEVMEKHHWQPHSHSNPLHARIKLPPADHDENGSLMPPPKHRPTQAHTTQNSVNMCTCAKLVT